MVLFKVFLSLILFNNKIIKLWIHEIYAPQNHENYVICLKSHVLIDLLHKMSQTLLFKILLQNKMDLVNKE